MGRSIRTTAVAVLVAAVAFGAAGGRAADAVDQSAILSALNAERAANGLPADVRENADWSASCAAHVAYMAAARALTHVEDPWSPLYTASGSWAGENSALAVGVGWEAGDPFANAPLHLIQLMSPELREVGVAQGSGYTCITTWPGYAAAGSDEPGVYTYPGPNTVGVPFAETVTERPFTPGDFVGLSPGKATGFNIMVFAEGIADLSRAHIVSATVTGPRGRVRVRTVDRTTPVVGAYLPPGGGFVIPVRPLRPGTTYQATVRFAGGPRHTWRFTTATN